MDSRGCLCGLIGRRCEGAVRAVVLLVWAAGGAGGAAWGQAPVAESADTGEAKAAEVVSVGAGAQDAATLEWTVEELQRRRKEIGDSDTIEAQTKGKLLEVYDKALSQLRLLEQHRTRKALFAQERAAAPAELEKLQAQLAEPPAEVTVQIPPGTTMTDLEQMAAAAQAANDDIAKRAVALEDEPQRQMDRASQIPELRTAAEEQLAAVKERLAAFTADADAPELAQANRMLLEIQQKTLEAQLATLEEERRYYSATRSLLTARRDVAGRLAVEAQTKLKLLRDALQEARRAQAEKLKADAAAAAAAAMYAHPVVKSLAVENARLAEIGMKVVAEIDSARQYGQTIQADLQRMEKDFKEVQEQAEGTDGVTHLMGILLLTKRSDLPDLRPHRQRLRSREGRASETQFTYFTYEKQWSALANIQTVGRQLLAQAGLDEGGDGYAAVYTETLKLLGEQRQIVRKISDDYRIYSGFLVRNDRNERRFIATVRAYAQFIDERILWVRGCRVLRTEGAAEIRAALQWLTSPANWRGVLDVPRADVVRHPAVYGLFVVLLGIVLFERRRMIGAMQHLTERVGTKYSDSFVHTWKTLALTFVLAAPWPAGLLFLSWRLQAEAAGGGFSEALAAGLWVCGWVVGVFRLGALFCRPGGLGQQLGFEPEVVAALRRHLAWFFSVLIPLTFLGTVCASQGMDAVQHNSLGRLFFVGEQVVLAVFLGIVLQPKGPVLQGYLADRRAGGFHQFQYLWYGVVVVIPMALSALAMSGYLYGAQHLYAKLVGTILFIGAVVFLNAFFRRWLAVVQKRIEIRRKRQQLAARAEAEGAGHAGGAEEAAPAAGAVSEETHEAQMGVMSQQAARLIRAFNLLVLVLGLWWIWRDVVPALEGLEAIAAWSTTDAKGNEMVVSVAALIKAMVLAVLTVIVARNLPGLVEMVVLQRLPFEAGSRFAVTTICRYAIIVVGVTLTFGQVGISWPKVQWLIAAMTVGLGFGLQEIFANFVSGLIILFEQPIRVGDMVTIGDVSGRVTQIRIRATTLRKYDQKELIVPNKEFITGRLINWSLSDKTLRLDFKVGVAYGSDIARAETTLYRIAQEHPLVIHGEPAPVVIFRGFGDSALDFELRLFVPNMDNYLKVWHEVNCAIDAEFRKAGIEIAFPQRDLHIRSGTLAIRRERPGPESR